MSHRAQCSTKLFSEYTHTLVVATEHITDIAYLLPVELHPSHSSVREAVHHALMICLAAGELRRTDVHVDVVVKFNNQLLSVFVYESQRDCQSSIDVRIH